MQTKRHENKTRQQDTYKITRELQDNKTTKKNLQQTRQQREQGRLHTSREVTVHVHIPPKYHHLLIEKAMLLGWDVNMPSDMPCRVKHALRTDIRQQYATTKLRRQK